MSLRGLQSSKNLPPTTLNGSPFSAINSQHSSSLTFPYPHSTHSHTLMLPAEGLCKGHFLYLKCSFQIYQPGSLPHLLKFLLRCHLPTEPLPDNNTQDYNHPVNTLVSLSCSIPFLYTACISNSPYNSLIHYTYC